MKDEPRFRLQQARARAGFKTPTDAAKELREININTLISNENGNRPISRKAAEKYGRLFGVPAGWILYGEKDEAAGIQVPVISLVSAGNLRDQEGITAREIERWIRVADIPKGDWVALTVDGDSMDRIAPHGSTILVNRADDRLLDGRFYVFALPNGDATFKRYRRKPESIQPYSTSMDYLPIPYDDSFYVFGRARRVITDV